MRVTVLLTALAPTAAAGAACIDDPATAELAAALLPAEPAPAPDVDGSLDDALHTQERFVAALQAEWDPPVGCKASMTSAAVQERFGATAPVRRILLRDMLLRDGATVPATFGTRPLFEATLLLVGNAGINEASTPEEVARHVSAIRPFIELPDLVVAEDQPLDAAVVTAINVGAFQCARRRDPGGRWRRHGRGSPRDDRHPDRRGEPRDRLRRRRRRSRPPAQRRRKAHRERRDAGPGDLVSVGSIGPLLPPALGISVTATYDGLPGSPSVEVSFE